MRNLITTAAVAVALSIGSFAPVAHAVPESRVPAVAQTAAAPAASVQIIGQADGTKRAFSNGKEVTDTILAHTPWTGKHFAGRYLCVQNNIGSFWDIENAAYAYESGTSTVIANYRPPVSWGGQPCLTSYVESQIVLVGTYNGPTNQCYTVNLPGADASGHYVDQVGIAMNASGGSGCTGTLQRRNNNISQAVGNSFGLANFEDSTGWSGSVLNEHWASVYNFAGADDRTSLYQRMQ
jgi:hypothetical protein